MHSNLENFFIFDDFSIILPQSLLVIQVIQIVCFLGLTFQCYLRKTSIDFYLNVCCK